MTRGEDVEGEGSLLAADVEGDALVEVAGLERLHPVCSSDCPISCRVGWSWL